MYLKGNSVIMARAVLNCLSHMEDVLIRVVVNPILPD